MSVIDEIKSKLDIVQYIEQYAPLKKAGRNYKANCPFHHERTPSFVVNPETQTWRCFGACAEGGDLFSFAMKQHGWTFSEALHELGSLAGVEVQKQTPEQKARHDRLDRLRGMLQVAADHYHKRLLNPVDEAGEAILQYVQETRGFTDQTIRQFQIGTAPDEWQYMLDHLKQLAYSEDEIIEVGLALKSESGRVYDRFRNRLMIPIRDERGRVVGFGARAYGDEQPKYLNSPQTTVFDKSQILFGLDMAKHAIRDAEAAIIVEGYMDVIQAHQAGYANVVAQMGTALTETQLRLIAPRYTRKIIVALDSDEAGRNATRRSLDVAHKVLKEDFVGRLAIDIRVLQIPDAKDPDDVLRESPELWEEYLTRTQSIADFVIEMETAQLTADSSVQERQAVAKQILPLLLSSEDNIYKKENLQKLALRLRIGESDLLAWAQEQQKRDPVKPSPSQSKERAHTENNMAQELNAVGQKPRMQIGRDYRVVEASCLRMLLIQPDLLYPINRKIRELAANDTILLEGPLSDLDVNDFTFNDYRALLALFLESMGQDELEPIEYMYLQLDDQLQNELTNIVSDEYDHVRGTIQYRYSGDTNTIWKFHEQKHNESQDTFASTLAKVLILRGRRLQHECDNLRFLQEEAEKEDRLRFGERMMPYLRAKQLIDEELNHRNFAF